MSTSTSLLINGERYEVEVVERTSRGVRFLLAGREYFVEFEETALQAGKHTPKSAPRPESRPGASVKSGQVISALPGVVVDIQVKPGKKVEAGAVLMRVEAMKMQNSIFAPITGTVSAIHVEVGMEVGDGQLLLEIQDEKK